MKAVVTGASGFVGTYLVAELVAQGHEVVATSRRRPKFLDDFPDVKFVPGDVRDRATMATALEGAQRVYHAAALFDFWATAKELLSVNAEGTKNLVLAMKDAGTKELVNVSSGAVYGKGYGNKLVTEDDAPLPVDKYARSKLEQEKAIAANAWDGLRTCSLRAGAIYGPGSRYGDASGLYLLKRGLLFGTPCWSKVISSHIHVKDVCRAAIHLGDKCLGVVTPETLASVAFNVSDDSPTFNEELLREVAAIIPEKGLLGFWRHIRLPGWGLKLAAYFVEAVAAVLGTRPPFEVASIDYITCGHGLANKKLAGTSFPFLYPNLLTGLRETVRWYEETDWRIFRDPDFLSTCVKRA